MRLFFVETGRQSQPAPCRTALVVADMIALAGALLLAYWLRFAAGVLPTPLGKPPLGPYAASIPLVILLGLFVFHQLGLYRRRRAAGLLRDIAVREVR